MFICRRCGVVVRERNNNKKYCTDCIKQIREEHNKAQSCEYCGKEITERRGNTKYCSKNCARNAEAHKRMKYISERAKAMQNKRGHVYRAYNFKCAICGWQATNEIVTTGKKDWYSHGLDIHHITPVAEGGTDGYNNLICLCPNCHRMVHMGLITQYQLKMHAIDIKKTEEKEKAKSKKKAIDNMTEWIGGING